MQVPLGKVLPDKKTLIQRSWGQTMVEKTKCQVYGQQTNLELSFKISNSRENFYYLNNFMMNKTTSCTKTIINMQQLLNMGNIFIVWVIRCSKKGSVVANEINFDKKGLY